MKRVLVLLAAVTMAVGAGIGAQPRPSDATGGAIQTAALKEWLTYIASDELQGREVYTEGLGLAASYIAEHLKRWGVKPVAEQGMPGFDRQAIYLSQQQALHRVRQIQRVQGNLFQVGCLSKEGKDLVTWAWKRHGRY